jgi:hypothetical protein
MKKKAKREKVFGIRLTKKEFEKICSISEKQMISPATWARILIMKELAA